MTGAHIIGVKFGQCSNKERDEIITRAKENTREITPIVTYPNKNYYKYCIGCRCDCEGAKVLRITERGCYNPDIE